MEYQTNILREYVAKSELRIVNDDFRVRLSSELAQKWDAGAYAEKIQSYANCIQEIKNLNIKYPADAKPIFYMYMVPDENFVQFLTFPYSNSKMGGKPVASYDLDCFNAAYGASQNCFENVKANMISMANIVNTIHEFAHSVHSMFFEKSPMLIEGFSEVLPLYTLNYEEKFDEHRDVIKNMTAEQMFTAEELLDYELWRTTRVQGKTCSFDWAYISSYLFVRGYVSRVEKKFKLDRIAATQKFLEMMRQTGWYKNQWLIFELADAIEMPREELWDCKTLQLEAQAEIAKI